MINERREPEKSPLTIQDIRKELARVGFLLANLIEKNEKLSQSDIDMLRSINHQILGAFDLLDEQPELTQRVLLVSESIIKGIHIDTISLNNQISDLDDPAGISVIVQECRRMISEKMLNLPLTIAVGKIAESYQLLTQMETLFDEENIQKLRHLASIVDSELEKIKFSSRYKKYDEALKTIQKFIAPLQALRVSIDETKAALDRTPPDSRAYPSHAVLSDQLANFQRNFKEHQEVVRRQLNLIDDVFRSSGE